MGRGSCKSCDCDSFVLVDERPEADVVEESEVATPESVDEQPITPVPTPTQVAPVVRRRTPMRRARTRFQASGDVLGTYDAYLCQACGSRYGQDDPEHPCGRLLPVTVTISVREETPGA